MEAAGCGQAGAGQARWALGGWGMRAGGGAAAAAQAAAAPPSHACMPSAWRALQPSPSSRRCCTTHGQRGPPGSGGAPCAQSSPPCLGRPPPGRGLRRGLEVVWVWVALGLAARQALAGRGAAAAAGGGGERQPRWQLDSAPPCSIACQHQPAQRACHAPPPLPLRAHLHAGSWPPPIQTPAAAAAPHQRDRPASARNGIGNRQEGRWGELGEMLRCTRRAPVQGAGQALRQACSSPSAVHAHSSHCHPPPAAPPLGAPVPRCPLPRRSPAAQRC